MKDLPPEETKVKMSTCIRCKGWVTVAVEHMMDDKSTKSFFKDAMKYNLNISTIPLLEFKKEGAYEMCGCPK